MLENRRCVEKALQFFAGVDVGLERTRDAGPMRWKWTGREVSTVDEPSEEPAQCLVFAFPPSRRRPFAATELTGRLRIDVTNSDVAESTGVGTKDPRIRGEHRSQGAFQSDVRIDGLEQCHWRPPRSSKATRRSIVRLTFA